MGQDGANLPARDYQPRPARKNSPNPNLVGQDGLILDLDSVSVHKHAEKKELGQYPAILTSHLVNNLYILLNFEFTAEKNE